ncbi:YukJ family protein [Paenibacillus oenotherae]|uniref:YukJ family protein n=1 Tax=Paenibacillus oenotherae TaxID=1435645 RepID=A0ABS7DCA3_9BACL|nr:YukJ family protein [Paenibacillus oenotherae]MBW7477541.1 YukJ family protein [Paenibacillus oenotherae]
MPIKGYGVLKGIAIDGKDERDNSTPHYQIRMIGEDNTDYRIAVNVMSSSHESEVLYLVDEQYDASSITILPTMSNGFTRITKDNRDIALDYVRGELFDPSKMVPLPHDKSGPDNDLNDKIQKYIEKAIKEKAICYVYGSEWGPENNKPDKIFGFEPGRGVHNVHMNQGNEGRWKGDNGSWQDGGILIQFKDKWVAIFLAFLSQSWCTNEKGHSTESCSHTDVKKREAVPAR